MKLRPLLYLLAGVAAILAFLVWPKGDGVYDPAKDAELQAVLNASPRGEELLALMAETPVEQQQELSFLLVNMPETDRETMDLALLKENVEYAHLARTKYKWARELPESPISMHKPA